LTGSAKATPVRIRAIRRYRRQQATAGTAAAAAMAPAAGGTIKIVATNLSAGISASPPTARGAGAAVVEGSNGGDGGSFSAAIPRSQTGNVITGIGGQPAGSVVAEDQIFTTGPTAEIYTGGLTDHVWNRRRAAPQHHLRALGKRRDFDPSHPASVGADRKPACSDAVRQVSPAASLISITPATICW
jgi:hypothetical protein